MDEAAAGDGAPGPLGVRARHIKKRALKNKTLSVSFNEKDLKDFVTGFHKRKKKRRKEALQKQEEAERRKRIEQRKKRKLDRDFVLFGGAPPDSGTDAAESDDEHDSDEDEGGEPVPSVSGMTTYDNGNVQVTVMTSEIAREEEYPINRPEVGGPESVEVFDKRKQRAPVARKKQLKKAPKKRSRAKTQSKRDKRKGKKKNKKH
ncbi:ribosomal RNA-processing protein 17 [Sesamum indicum]|uniref:Ribosomal RNA-processing protein 17 n=1 Tax=Sesamum indicum TaxID=4182 RepID=A0A6I9TXD1_SESIN|nr:ribosomal RNA-processing protein 17 [Sesamum indicum]